MRIFAAGLATETNTFAPDPTGWRDFEQGGLFRGDAGAGGSAPQNLVARWYRERAAADGHDFVEGLFAWAQPSGPTEQAVYEALRDEIVAAVRGGGFDVVLLYLHGAMVATACDDCEGDLLRAIRAVAGPRCVIGAELDPHCHLSEAMVEAADVLIAMKEYPHTDFLERAAELYAICTRAAAGELKPVSAVVDCRMIGFYPTTHSPMAELLARLREAERAPGVLSLSFVHGFPWGDTPDTGSKMLAIADGDAELARGSARRLARAFYAQRRALLPKLPDIDTALNEVVRGSGTVVLADTADNPGGGAPGDNVSLLRALLERRCRRAVYGCVWDPEAAAAAAAAGVGASLELRLGGRCGVASGEPLALRATVRAVRERHEQAGLGVSRVALGLSVWLECEGIDVAVISLRNQTFAPDAFTGLGISLENRRLIAVKSSQHFRTHFAPLAHRVIAVATPGAIQMDFATIPYRKRRDLDFFPRVPDPWG